MLSIKFGVRQRVSWGSPAHYLSTYNRFSIDPGSELRAVALAAVRLEARRVQRIARNGTAGRARASRERERTRDVQAAQHRR